MSDALAAQDTLNRELNARSQQAAANTRAAELAQTRYQAGATDYFRVLQAQQDQLQSQQQREQAHTQQQLASTQLYRALGGSWVSAVSD